MCEYSSCAATFSRKHDLRRHMRSLHSEDRPHHCAHCNLSFARSDALKRHLASEAKRNNSHPAIVPDSPGGDMDEVVMSDEEFETKEERDDEDD